MVQIGASDGALFDAILSEAHDTCSSDLFGIAPSDFLENPSNRVLIAYAGERPIGCICANRADAIVLHSLGVVPDKRGQGYGSRLIEAAIGAGGFPHETATDYWTAVDPKIPAAAERFIRQGFQVYDEAPLPHLKLLVLSR